MQQPPNVPRQPANWPDADLPPEDDAGIARLQQQYRMAQMGQQSPQGGPPASQMPRQQGPPQPGGPAYPSQQRPLSPSEPLQQPRQGINPSQQPLQPQQAAFRAPQQGGMPPQQQGNQPPRQPQQGGMPPNQGGLPPRQPQQGGMPPQQQGNLPPRQPQQGGLPPQQQNPAYRAPASAPMPAQPVYVAAQQPAEMIPPSMQQQVQAPPARRINISSAGGSGLLLYAILLLIGTGFGLMWAYVISPPEFVGANANRLNETSQDQWVQMVAVAYVRDGYDDVNASILLSQVDNPGAIVDRLLNNPGLAQPDRVALEEIRPLAAQIMGTASPQAAGMPFEAVEVVIPLGLAAIVGLVLGFLAQLMRRNNAAV